MANYDHLEKLLTIVDQNTKELDYWKDKYSDNFTKSSFPYDFNDKQSNKSNTFSNQKQRKKIYSFSINDKLFNCLMKICKASDYTLHLVLMSSIIGLLFKYTNNKDLFIGTPIYDQGIDGKLTNTLLALRSEVNDDIDFKGLLMDVKHEFTTVLQNQNFPLEVLIDELKLPYEEDFPLFDVILILENIQNKQYIEHIYNNVNVIFCFNKRSDSIIVELIYSTLKYQKKTIEKIASNYLNLLSIVLDQINFKLADICLISENERQEILNHFNNSIGTPLLHHTIHDWFDKQVKKTPDKVAVIGDYQEKTTANQIPSQMNRNQWKLSISYKKLNDRANQIAIRLCLKGVMADSIVGIMLDRSIDLIASIIGVLKVGGGYLPINPQYPQERIFYMLNDCRASLLLTSKHIKKKFSYTELLSLNLNPILPHRTPKPSPSNFNNLPKLDRSLINYDRYSQYIGHAMVKHSIGIQPTRGCPFHCTYCHRIWPKSHTYRTAENLFSEVETYYKLGIKRFVIIDDVFNFNVKNSSHFFDLIIKNKLNLHFFFPNGMRGDILSREYIDRMVEAGTVNLDLALETASPRIQRLIGKNLDLDKLKSNLQYLCKHHPHVVLDLGMMIGFPSETEDEAMMTMNFLKEILWVHFPYPFILKIHPNTEIGKLALKKGISARAISRSMNHSYHDIPETLPFSKRFAREYKSKFMSEYFFLKSRLKKVLPQQMKIATEDELVQKYNNYLPMEIKKFSDIISYADISMEELGNVQFLPQDYCSVPGIDKKINSLFPSKKKSKKAFRVLLLDVSELFSSQQQNILHGEIPEPLGIMSLLTYLNELFGEGIDGKIAKSRVDFDSFEQLKTLINDFKPDLIGMRTLSYYKDFFHRTVSQIKKWGIDVPIIAGGPYATMDYVIILQDPSIDIAVLGEGEETFANVVKEFMKNGGNRPSEDILMKIRGIAFIRDNEIPFLKQSFREIVNIEEIEKENVVSRELIPNQLPKSYSLAYVMYTSGSTGKPKGVMLEHKNVVNLLQYDFQCTNMDFSRLLQFHTIGFDASFHEIFCALLSGGELLLINSNMLSNIAELFEIIKNSHIKTLFFPASYLRFIFSEDIYISSFPRSVTHIQVAGEQIIINEKLKRYLKEKKIHLHNHYGPTETHVVTSLTVSPGEEIPLRPSIGKPITNTLVYILDSKHYLLPPGIMGELCIGGIQVGRGYLNNPELTSEKFCLWRPGAFLKKDAPGPCENFLFKQKILRGVQGGGFLEKSLPPRRRQRLYRTGDLCRWLSDGNIEFLGRIDHQVKVRGFRVELGDIEIQLLNYSGIKESVVIANEDDNRDNFLSAYFVADEEIDIQDLQDFLSKELPDYMIPNFIVPLERIPLTVNGKVDRKSLPEPSLKLGQIQVLPRNQLEKKLANMWNDVLGNNQLENTQKIGIDSNFFDLGGQSLRATILISKLHREFSVKVPLSEIFKTPTIRGLATYIQYSSKDNYIRMRTIEKKDYYPLSSAQNRLYILQQAEKQSASYNIPGLYQIGGEIDEEKFERTFQQLIKRHDSFRTSFHLIQGKPGQRIRDDVEFKIEYIELDGEKSRKESIDSIPDILKEFIRSFDLSEVPLLKVRVLKTGISKYLFMVDMHHIIGDGFSLSILVKEFMALYSGEFLQPLNFQYRDFSEWQSTNQYAILQEKMKAYWLKQFEKDIPFLDLPMDHPEFDSANDQGDTLFFEIGVQEAVKITELCKQQELSLFIVLLAVFYVFIAKLSGMDDITVGTFTSGRTNNDLQSVVGMFVNTLVLRNFPMGEKAFLSFLGEVKKNTLEAMENQDYPFADLVENVDQKVGENTRRNPLFDTLFSVQNIDIPSLEVPGLKLMPIQSSVSTAKFDLSIYITEERECITGMVEYRTILFKKETIENFIKYYKEILLSVLNNINIKIKDIKISHHLFDKKIENPTMDFTF